MWSCVLRETVNYKFACLRLLYYPSMAVLYVECMHLYMNWVIFSLTGAVSPSSLGQTESRVGLR